MGPMPLFPASRLRQTSSVPMPQPQISPTPVTTTRRFKRNFSYTDCTDWDGQWLLASFGVLLDVIDGVFDRGNFLGILVRNLNAEIFLESHDQLDRVERVGAQVVHKGSSRRNFTFVHTELLDNDCLHAFFDAGHSDCSSGIGDLASPGPYYGRVAPQDSLPILCKLQCRVNLRRSILQPFPDIPRRTLSLCPGNLASPCANHR